MKKKICVFFGAGAESSFGLSDGKDFAVNVLGIKEENKNIIAMNDAIKKHYEKLTKNNDWYPEYSCYGVKFEKLLKSAKKKKSLSKSNDHIIDDNEIVDKYTSYMGILDEKFYTLISPKEFGPVKFWKVINAYTRAYLLLSSEIIYKNKVITKKHYDKILKNPVYTRKKIKKFALNFKEKSYYSIIKDNNENNNINIITTNYTSLCKNICQIDYDKIAYIHGRFGLFEIPDKLQIIDVKDKESQKKYGKELYFPYIAIQSGVKPIIDATQIKEYNKMLEFLDTSDILIIVGFALNIDDNHINCILRQYLVNKKITIYFLDYNNSLTEIELYNRLRIDVNDVDNLFYVPIDNDNAYDEFEKLIKNGEL